MSNHNTMYAIISIIALSVALILGSNGETTSILSKSIHGARCMSSCVDYKFYKYCYMSSGWEYCDHKSTDEPIPQYYTIQGKLCNGDCRAEGQWNLNWCYTGSTYYANWDYCSPKHGYTISQGRKCNNHCKWNNQQNYYTCNEKREQELVPLNPGDAMVMDSYTTDRCSPSPQNLTFFKLMSDTVKTRFGRYSSYFYFEKCSKVKRLSENILRTIGVEELADRYQRIYPPSHINLPVDPITLVVTTDAPPMRFMRNVDITLAMRATIRPQHLRQRDVIPSFVNIHMDDLNALPGDERGHLLAASLGGPTLTYNFAPQTPILNRGAYGDSYWFSVEDDIRTFLRQPNAGHVMWTLVIIYDLNISRRPTGFGLRIRMFDNQNAEVRDTDNLFFSNDPNGGCPI